MRRVARLLPIALAACGADAKESGAGGGALTEPCELHVWRGADGSCCPAGWLADDAGCLAPGVAVCGDGFSAEADGCTPLLPAPCPPGTLALPGDSACAPLMPCGSGNWGDEPLAAGTHHVDATYTAPDADGSAGKPWPTIQQAIDAAPNGATVAIAAGNYVEDVLLQNKALQIRGRCPDMVRLTGLGGQAVSLLVLAGASGSSVEGIRIGGPLAGVGVTGSLDVRLARVWIEGALRGVVVQDDLAPTSAIIERVLIEDNRDVGLFTWGSELSVSDSLIRGTTENGAEAANVVVLINPTTQVQSVADITHSVIEQSQDIGLFVEGGVASATGVVFRDNGWPTAIAPNGVTVDVHAATGVRGSLTLSQSVVQGSAAVGVFVTGGDLLMSNSVVRDTLPNDGVDGRGVQIQVHPTLGVPASANILHGLVERSVAAGVVCEGSSLALSATIIRDTWPQPADARLGRGLSIQYDSDDLLPSSAAVSGILVERSHDVGIVVSGSNVTMDAFVISDTAPQALDDKQGRGMHVQWHGDGAISTIALSRGLWLKNHDVGLMLTDANATIALSTIADTRARAADGLFGDGMVAVSNVGTAVTVTDASIRDNARLGIGSYGGAIGIGSSAMSCNAIDLSVALHDGQQGVISDLGANVCGCASAKACAAISTSLAPPDPLP